MNKKEYYNKMMNRLYTGLTELIEMDREYSKMERTLKSGGMGYSQRQGHISNMAMLLSETKQKQKDIENDLRSINEEYIAVLRKEDALNPADMTEDCALLNSGIPLTANDITAILERNPNNRTMAQLCTRYATANGIRLGVEYNPAEKQIGELEAMLYRANAVLKYHNSPNLDNIYSDLVGEKSGMLEWANAE